MNEKFKLDILYQNISVESLNRLYALYGKFVHNVLACAFTTGLQVNVPANANSRKDFLLSYICAIS